jgi:hypothetical protein
MRLKCKMRFRLLTCYLACWHLDLSKNWVILTKFFTLVNELSGSRVSFHQNLPSETKLIVQYGLIFMYCEVSILTTISKKPLDNLIAKFSS